MDFFPYLLTFDEFKFLYDRLTKCREPEVLRFHVVIFPIRVVLNCYVLLMKGFAGSKHRQGQVQYKLAAKKLKLSVSNYSKAVPVLLSPDHRRKMTVDTKREARRLEKELGKFLFYPPMRKATFIGIGGGTPLPSPQIFFAHICSFF